MFDFHTAKNEDLPLMPKKRCQKLDISHYCISHCATTPSVKMMGRNYRFKAYLMQFMCLSFMHSQKSIFTIWHIFRTETAGSATSPADTSNLEAEEGRVAKTLLLQSLTTSWKWPKVMYHFLQADKMLPLFSTNLCKTWLKKNSQM